MKPKHGFSSHKHPKGTHKTAKRLAAKKVMLAAKTAKKGKRMYRPSRARN